MQRNVCQKKTCGIPGTFEKEILNPLRKAYFSLPAPETIFCNEFNIQLIFFNEINYVNGMI